MTLNKHNTQYKNLGEYNEQFQDDTYPMLPNVGKNNITIIHKGLYKKPGAKFRGVTAKLIPGDDKYTIMMNGMFDLKENIVIVPESLDIETLTPMKRTLLDSCIASGYKVVPKLQHYEQRTYPLDSEEGRLALANLTTFKSKNA